MEGTQEALCLRSQVSRQTHCTTGLACLLYPKEAAKPAEPATWAMPLPRERVLEDIALATGAESPGVCAGPPSEVEAAWQAVCQT